MLLVGLVMLVGCAMRRAADAEPARRCMALGAQPVAILALVARQGLFVCSAGLVFGALGAVVAARFLARSLYGISAADPAPWAAALAIVLVASTLANVVPARRAVSVDPTRALRTE